MPLRRAILDGMAGSLKPSPATLADLAAAIPNDRLELVGGELVEKAAPSVDHGFAESRLAGRLDPFNRRPGRRGPGGWWIAPDTR
jgi:hypothetical protein